MSISTTYCQAWILTKTNGETLGFTDHDFPVTVVGVRCLPQKGLNASAIQQNTGMSIDNTEAMGVISDQSIRDADIKLGLYDGAILQKWRVDWSDQKSAELEFEGAISEITQKDHLFHAEVQSSAAALNRPIGQVYQKPCSAVLGGTACGVSLDDPLYAIACDPLEVLSPHKLIFEGLSGYDYGWFAHGFIEITYENKFVKTYPIKRDDVLGELRQIELWIPLLRFEERAQLRLVAGCDKRFETCRVKFQNAANFQGFPDIPSQDWMLVHPTQSSKKFGGSRR